MRSIRTFAYAAALGMSMFTVQPTLAAAQEIHGSFTLAHEAHCQNAVLKAGEYSFSVKTMGSFEFLMLRGVNGTGTDAMVMVNDVGTPRPHQVSKLELVSRAGQSFVSSMELPEYDLSLRFAVPSEKTTKMALVERASK
jgi:hypothetical protein